MLKKNYRTIMMAALAAVACAVLSSCAQSNKNQITLMDEEKFGELLEKQEVQVLDVRTQPEYLSGHLPNAVNININSPRFDSYVEEKLTHEIPVAVYCLGGKRSHIAADILVDMGYRVYELKGGISTWKGPIKR